MLRLDLRSNNCTDRSIEMKKGMKTRASSSPRSQRILKRVYMSAIHVGCESASLSRNRMYGSAGSEVLLGRFLASKESLKRDMGGECFAMNGSAGGGKENLNVGGLHTSLGAVLAVELRA